MALKKYALSDVCTIVPGFAFKSNEFGSGENIAVKIKDIEPPSVNIKNAERVCFTPQDKFRLSKGDYIMAMTGATIGKVGKLQIDAKNVYINQRVCKFNPITSVCDKEYLYYVLSSPSFRNFIYNNVDSKLAQPNIGHPTIYKYTHLFPTDIKEQKLIASVLNNIDRKIELNKQINDNLEAMAKQLYDYWFVQFDFPNEEGKPYKSSGGAMVWNENLKREIPQGWNDCKIKDFMRIFTGKKDVSKAVPGNYKFFSCAPEPISSNEYIYDGYAVLVSGNGSYTGRVGFYKGKFDLYQRTYACVLDEDEHNISFFYYTLRYLFQPIYSGGKHGSSIPYIVLGDLADFRFAFNETICTKFVDATKPMFDEQLLRQKEIEVLTKQRDELLPLLMNGQATVNYHLSAFRGFTTRLQIHAFTIKSS